MNDENVMLAGLVSHTSANVLQAPLFALREEARVAAGRRGVDRNYLLSGKASQIIRATSFRSGAREAAPAERLCADHRTDHIAVHIDVAVGEPRDDVGGGLVDARVNAEGQAVATAGDVLDELLERIGAPAHHMQHRAEDLFAQIAGAIERNDRRSDVEARGGRVVMTEDDAADMPPHPIVELLLRVGLDLRADLRPDLAPVAPHQRARRSL